MKLKNVNIAKPLLLWSQNRIKAGVLCKRYLIQPILTIFSCVFQTFHERFDKKNMLRAVCSIWKRYPSFTVTQIQEETNLFNVSARLIRLYLNMATATFKPGKKAYWLKLTRRNVYRFQRNGLMPVSIFGKVKLLFILTVLVLLIRVIRLQKRHVLEQWLEDNTTKGYN